MVKYGIMSAGNSKPYDIVDEGSIVLLMKAALTSLKRLERPSCGYARIMVGCGICSQSAPIKPKVVNVSWAELFI